MSEQPRRLVFGEVAELYDAARPTYPAALVDDLVKWASAGRNSPVALEVGAGTGKATRLMAARGVAVLAVEPSAEMAALARRTTAETGLVEVIESDFEHAQLGGRRFPLVYAGQAWHWVSVPRGYALARAALVDGGRLVPFWNRPIWERTDLRAELDEVYTTHVPADLGGGPYDPSAPRAADPGAEWAQQIASVPGLTQPEVREYEWSLSYTAAAYVDLVATHSETRLLAPEPRARFLQAVRAAIETNGGSFTLSMRTLACVARAV